MEDKYKKFAKEILLITILSGKTNFILKSEIEDLLNDYDLNLEDLSRVKL